jgi:hypothetical protein
MLVNMLDDTWLWTVTQTGHYQVGEEIFFLKKDQTMVLDDLTASKIFKLNFDPKILGTPLWKVIFNEEEQKYNLPPGRYKKTESDNTKIKRTVTKT